MGDEASLYSDRRRSTSMSSAALWEDDRRMTGCETRRVSSTKQGRKNAGMIFGAKLDGLATSNTAGSGRDV